MAAPVAAPPPLPAPAPTAQPTATNVQMTESVSVAPELHEAGARTVPPQPGMPSLQATYTRSRRRTLVAAAAVAGIGSVVFALGLSGPKPRTEQPAIVTPTAKPIAKATVTPREEDDLAPLPRLAPRVYTPAVAKRRAPRPAVPIAPEPAPESSELKPAPSLSSPAQSEVPLQDDFGFLEGADAPKSALPPAH
jgi:hypothetical protein